MKAISYTEARANLAKTMDAVEDDCEPVIITRGRGKSCVLMSLEQYESMDETAYLLSSPVNARRLMEAMAEFERGGGQEHELDPGA